MPTRHSTINERWSSQISPFGWAFPWLNLSYVSIHSVHYPDNSVREFNLRVVYFIQGHQFNIFEGVRCTSAIPNTIHTFFLSTVWPIPIGLASATYCGMRFYCDDECGYSFESRHDAICPQGAPYQPTRISKSKWWSNCSLLPPPHRNGSDRDVVHCTIGNLFGGVWCDICAYISLEWLRWSSLPFRSYQPISCWCMNWQPRHPAQHQDRWMDCHWLRIYVLPPFRLDQRDTRALHVRVYFYHKQDGHFIDDQDISCLRLVRSIWSGFGNKW